MSLSYTFEAENVSVEPTYTRNKVDLTVSVSYASDILEQIDMKDILDFVDRDEALSHFEPKPDDLDENDMVEYLRSQGWVIED